MTKKWLAMVLGMMALLLAHSVAAEQVSREQLKGLDEQVQEIKSDVLDIASELNLLEEKLLYPSHTEVAVFVSMTNAEGLRLDSLDLRLDDRDVAHHLYTFKELEALQKGGVQRLYTGNVVTGAHPLQVTLRGKTSGGGNIDQTVDFSFQKSVGPGIVEIVIDKGTISFKSH